MKKIKKAEIVGNTTIEFLIAAAGIFLLLLLLFKIIGSYDKMDKTGQSYFNTLKNQMKVADSGKIGEFLIWENENFYLVYFGKNSMVWGLDKDEKKISFFLNNPGANKLCICYLREKEGEIKDYCHYCESLKYPAKYAGFENENFVIRQGETVQIKREDDKYIFFPIK
ncbi:MAG: hypothetical protein ACOYT4_04355 [Nanoarchaeota archaeon]